jgi:gliding motility-associated-like protein
VSGTVLYAPTAFSPNNDGINDAWIPVATGVTAFQLEVFDRWGKRVWYSENKDTPWIGQHETGDYFVQDGIYSWILRIEDDLRNPEIFTGNVLLFR